jgi:hypothetical protein
MSTFFLLHSGLSLAPGENTARGLGKTENSFGAGFPGADHIGLLIVRTAVIRPYMHAAAAGKGFERLPPRLRIPRTCGDDQRIWSLVGWLR